MKLRATHRRWLMELTNLPTAAGREQRVMAWVRRWLAEHPRWTCRNDPAGNMVIARRGARSPLPVVLTAHLDHPAFVVTKVVGATRVEAEFRGGVDDAYFPGARVRHHPSMNPTLKSSTLLGPGGSASVVGVGAVTKLWPADKTHRYKRAMIQWRQPTTAQVGDVVTWDLPAPSIIGDLYHAPACDDLAAVAAALAALDELDRSHSRPRPGGQTVSRRGDIDARLLLTRAEEIGFVGAIAACHHRTLPKGARLIALEMSRMLPDAPQGAGPIVRVGDRISTFDPRLTYRAAQIAAALEKSHPGFRWQRKLMTGGACEATAYQTLGHQATCVCLALGNYHNMTPAPGSPPGNPTPGSSASTAKRRRQAPRLAREFIHLGDYAGLVQLLTQICLTWDDADTTPPLTKRLAQLYHDGRGVL